MFDPIAGSGWGRFFRRRSRHEGQGSRVSELGSVCEDSSWLDIRQAGRSACECKRDSQGNGLVAVYWHGSWFASAQLLCDPRNLLVLRPGLRLPGAAKLLGEHASFQKLDRGGIAPLRVCLPPFACKGTGEPSSPKKRALRGQPLIGGLA